MEEEIRNMGVLVDVVANKIRQEIERGNTEGLKEMLWAVPVNILAEYAKDHEGSG